MSTSPQQKNKETATLAGGCFWCLEAIFDQINGVEDVISGYSGGNMDNPTYKAVCSGNTGHAEVIQIVFNPEIITYRDLLHIFFSIHDPTTINRQGADVGTQYRSAIFFHSLEQAETAREVIRQLAEQKKWKDPIVTEVNPFTHFYPAEDYHQEYYTNNPNQMYCQLVITPKIAKFKKLYKNM